MPRGTCTALLKVPVGDERLARAVESALEPDNENVPAWLRVECRASGCLVECWVKVEGCEDPRRIMSLRNTLDDLILNLRASLAAVEAAGE